MSKKELQRVEVLARVHSGELRLLDAAEILRLCYRQTKRLWRRYRQEGAAGLQHRNAGRASNRAKPEAFREQVLAVVRAKYAGSADEPCFGPTLAAEHLAADEHLTIDAETLRRWMLQVGLWKRQRGKPRQHRHRRARKEHFGELVQLDGSFHGWFEKRGPKGCLMNMIDDATSITVAQMGKQETIWAAVAVLRCWMARYGVPVALYTDWRNVYKIPPTAKQELHGQEPLSQFGRMCAELGIRIVAAHSPQAKGRVERNNGVHQDRLVKELRLKSIASYASANTFLDEEYLPGLNQRFAKSPQRSADYHRSQPSAAELDAIFRLRHERWVSKDWVLRYKKRLFQLLPAGRIYGPTTEAVVYESPDGRLEMRYRGEKMAFRELPGPLRPAAAETAVHVPHSRPRIPPTLEHPYKRYANNEIKRRRRRLLQQVIAARTGGSASAPPPAANPAAAACAPAPPPVTSPAASHPPQGTLLTS